MFVVLTVDRSPRTLAQRLGSWAGGGPLTVERKSFLGNGYYHITDRTSGRPHWEQLRRAVGRAATRLVMGEGEQPPPGCGLRLYEPMAFYGRVTAMAGVQALGAMGPRQQQATVAMVDEDGLCTWCAGELARHCAVLKVYTREPQRYQVLCRELLEGYGANLLLADTPGELAGCDFAVSPAPTGVWKLPMPVLTVDRSGIQGSPTINRLVLDLSPELEALLEPGVDPLLFLGATWETGVRRFPLDMGVKECRIDGRRADIRELLLLEGGRPGARRMR